MTGNQRDYTGTTHLSVRTGGGPVSGPVYSPAYFSAAFNAFGSANNVTGGSGPAALVGAIGLNGQTITKAGPGFNINGITG